MSRSRARKKSVQVVRPSPAKGTARSTTATVEREPRSPVLIPLDDVISPILENRRNNRKSNKGGMRSISQAWDDTEALGITADMRRSGPGMLSDQDRKDTLYKAYLNSVWISACVDVISKRITSGGYTIEYCGSNEQPTPEEEAQKQQLQAFVEYTNDDEDFLQLVRSIVTDILIYGECFVEVVKQDSVPYSLHKIDCITMNYTLDPHGKIVKYIQNLYHSTETIEFQPDEVIRFWLPSPQAAKIALSPIERIMGSIDADVHMSDWVRSFFRKGARPNFWIKFPGPKEEADRFVIWLRENYTGMANAHVPLVLYDEAELYEIGKGSVDVDFLKGRELMCKEILAGYQVPPALVGLIESGNIGGGTGESQEKSFLRNACDPIKAMVMGQINYRITWQGFQCKCWRIGTHYADYREEGSVSVIRDRDIRNGSLNVNEVRRDMNRPPVEGGDVNIFATSRELQPLDRLNDLSQEQAAQAEATTAHVQAQATLAQAQADKLKEPPPEPTPPAQPPAPAKPSPDEQEQAQERVILRRQLSSLIEQLELRQHTEDVRRDAAQLILDALKETRLPQEEPSPRVASLFENIEEHLRAIREQNAARAKQEQEDEEWDALLSSPENQQRLDAQAKRIREDIKAGRYEEGGFDGVVEDQQHTGMMIAFMLDPETAEQLAIPGGEPADALHVTIAFLGDSADETLPRNPAQKNDDLAAMQHIIASVASQESPLQGTIGGLGRFAASTDSDSKDPVIALVDMPGLVELRMRLVSELQAGGFFVASNHGYTPHVTLAYIDTDTPMPIESIPSLPLTFGTVCLAIGDTNYYFKLGENDTHDSEETTEQTPDTQSTECDILPSPQTSEDIPARSSEPGPSPAATPEDAQLTAELARWRERAIEDVKTQIWRGFTTTIIPEAMHTDISKTLPLCPDASYVRAVFECWGLPPEWTPEHEPTEPLEEHAYPHDKIVLQKRIHEIFSNVAERGHKALGEESES